MSSRIDKRARYSSSLSSTERRKNIADAILYFGATMPNACSRCRKEGVECRIGLRSGKCGACGKANVACDVTMSRREWEKMKEEHRRLRQEAAAAEEAVEQAHMALAEALARRSRISKQLLHTEEKAVRAIEREEEYLEVVDPGGNDPGTEFFGPSVEGEEELPAIDWSFLDNGAWGIHGAGPDNPLTDVDPIAETS